LEVLVGPIRYQCEAHDRKELGDEGQLLEPRTPFPYVPCQHERRKARRGMRKEDIDEKYKL
jgi:hypothetical protein